MSSLLASLIPSRRRLLIKGYGRRTCACLRSRRLGASAGLINTDSCDNATLTQPFAPWGDSGYYKLVPGGDFEGSMAGGRSPAALPAWRGASLSARPAR